jgi:hypothetical protein
MTQYYVFCIELAPYRRIIVVYDKLNTRIVWSSEAYDYPNKQGVIYFPVGWNK